MGGASELAIATQLHHASLQTTKRYVHFHQAHMLKGVGIMEGVIERALLTDTASHQVPITAREDARTGVIVETLEAQRYQRPIRSRTRTTNTEGPPPMKMLAEWLARIRPLD